MRHQAALGRKATIWEDLGIGVAVFALTAAIVIGIGLVDAATSRGCSSCSAPPFSPGIAASGRPSSPRVLSTIAIAPITNALDAGRSGINLHVRTLSIAIVCGVVSWLCGNLYRSRERLLIEQSRLRESESFHRLIGELASDFAFHARIELGGQIVIDSATSGLKAVLGYTLEDLQARPGLSLIHPEDRADIQDALEPRRRRRRSEGRSARDRQGRPRRVRRVSARIPSEIPTAAWPACSGRSATCRCRSSSRPRWPPSGSGCSSTSASARKSKRELRKSKEEAERRANEAEEARAAVKDREQRLHYEAQLKDEFLATLAHELRNPLAPLRNVAEILRLEALSETARQATGVMERQISQLVRLIDDLMDVSRITRGQLTLRRERVDLRSIIESAVETAQPQMTTAGVQLTIDLPEQPLDAPR